MNFISFSLFGRAPIYLAGMIRNAQLAREHYPGWRVVVYADKNVPEQVTDDLRKLYCDVRALDPDVPNQMFQRFLVADDPACKRFIIRDADSRLGPRERAAVDEWIESGLDFHVMSDHPFHWPPIGGGMWGARANAIKGMKALILKSKLTDKPYAFNTAYNKDQVFLRRYVLPLAKGKLLRHDSCCRDIFPDAMPFPGGCCFGDERFVGEVFDERDQPNPWHWQMRVPFMTC